jgi:hypothetical protein
VPDRKDDSSCKPRSDVSHIGLLLRQPLHSKTTTKIPRVIRRRRAVILKILIIILEGNGKGSELGQKGRELFYDSLD